MTYNAKTLIIGKELGNPYDDINTGLDLLLQECKKLDLEARVKATFLSQGTTRYAISQITQHTDIQSITFSLLLIKDKKTIHSNTTKIDNHSLKFFVKNTFDSLKLVPQTSFIQGLPDPIKGETVNLSGKEWTIEDRTDTIIEAVNAAEEINKNVMLAGTVAEEKKYSRIVTTNGIDIEDSSQSNYIKTNAIIGNPDNRGYGEEELYWRFKKPNVKILAQKSTQTAIDSTNLVDLPAPKDFEIILSPTAVENLLSYAALSLDPISYHESNSFATDRLGDLIFDKQITIEDLPRDPHQANIVASFDNEGIPTSNKVIFDKGVLLFIPYNSFYASKYLQDKNLVTGNDITAFSYVNHPSPVSLAIKPGLKEEDTQIQEVENGLYVKSFYYNRFTIRRKGGLTGITRNGLYQIKNGEIIGSVRNLRYTESFVNAFGPENVISVSKRREQKNLINSPSIHLKKYHFSSVAHKMI